MSDEDKIVISKVTSREVQEAGTNYTVQVDSDGVEYWYLSGSKTLHRRNGPAIIHPNGDECWYVDGYLARTGAPAIIKDNGATQYWYDRNRLHRYDGPAVINQEGKFWYRDHLLHREDGPAAEWSSGLLEWYNKGSFQKDSTGRRNIYMSVEDPNTAPPVIKAKQKPRTQKARSILNGCLELQEDADYCYMLRGFGNKMSVMNKPVLIQNEQDILDIDTSFWLTGKKIFARPCPMVPRHGFVDSRVIKDKSALRKLFNRTRKIDPEAEIVLTTFLEGAACNAILTTSGILSIGPGHDGATAGKDSFSIPVKPETLRNSIRKSAGVMNYDNCFIEAVFTPNNKSYESFYYTQVRGGPVIDAAVVDFIPAEMVVQTIIPPNDNLVEWEAQVKKLAPGTVVYGAGHTLASHAAIHCVINNVPFITSFEPKVGERIKPALAGQAKLSLRDFKIGITLGLDSNINMCHMLHLSMAIIHNWAYLKNSKHSSWMLGLAAGYFTKVLCTLNFGEYRYAGQSHLSREEVYKTILKSDKFGSYMKHCPKIAKDFTSGLFNSGYGGKKWANAVYMCIDIWNLISEINESKFDVETANKMVEKLNKATNLVHNNGWLFNKISSKNLLNFISKSPSLAILQLSDVLYQNYLARQSVRKTRKINKILLKSNEKVDFDAMPTPLPLTETVDGSTSTPDITASSSVVPFAGCTCDWCVPKKIKPSKQEESKQEEFLWDKEKFAALGVSEKRFNRLKDCNCDMCKSDLKELQNKILATEKNKSDLLVEKITENISTNNDSSAEELNKFFDETHKTTEDILLSATNLINKIPAATENGVSEPPPKSFKFDSFKKMAGKDIDFVWSPNVKPQPFDYQGQWCFDESLYYRALQLTNKSLGKDVPKDMVIENVVNAEKDKENK